MRLRLLPLVLVPMLAVAAPVLKRARTMQTVYGLETDAKGECKLEMGRDGALAVIVPTTERPTDPKRVAWRRPIVAKSVEGDFVLTTRVTLGPPSNAGTQLRGEPPACVAGVSLWAAGTSVDNPRCAVAAVGGYLDRGGWQMWDFHYEWGAPDRAMGMDRAELNTDRPIFLRVVRKGDQVTHERSIDGREWHTAYKAVLAGPISVGPVAFQSTDQEWSVTFDDYELTSLANDEKK